MFFFDDNIYLTKYNPLLHCHWQCNPPVLHSKILSLGQMNAFIEGYLYVDSVLLWQTICRWLCGSERIVGLSWKKMI